jgi:hypothetical protein
VATACGYIGLADEVAVVAHVGEGRTLGDDVLGRDLL